MRHRRNVSPQVETLETLTLLSGAAASAQALLASPPRATTVTLGGTARGDYNSQHITGAMIYDIRATGKLASIGAAKITGYLQVDHISSGPPSGTLYLATSRGTLTLQIPYSVMLPKGMPTPTSPHQIVDTYVISNGMMSSHIGALPVAILGEYQGPGVVEITFTGGHSAGDSLSGGVNIKFTTLHKTTTTT